MNSSLEIQSFDPATWLNEYVQPVFPVSDEVFDQILKFSLIWNLFEGRACNRNASWKTIQRSVDCALAAGMICTNNFEAHIDFFRNRAKAHHDSINGYIAALKTNQPRMDALLRDLLIETHMSASHEITALLLIAYRVRSNLFHGEKEVAYLHTQSELFKAVNSMLATYLSLTTCAT